MPRDGYKAITVPTKVYERLSKQASELNISIPKIIERLLGNA